MSAIWMISITTVIPYVICRHKCLYINIAWQWHTVSCKCVVFTGMEFCCEMCKSICCIFVQIVNIICTVWICIVMVLYIYIHVYISIYNIVIKNFFWRILFVNLICTKFLPFMKYIDILILRKFEEIFTSYGIINVSNFLSFRHYSGQTSNVRLSKTIKCHFCVSNHILSHY